MTYDPNDAGKYAQYQAVGLVTSDIVQAIAAQEDGTIGLLTATLVAFGAALLNAAPTSRLHYWFGVMHHQGWSIVVVGSIGLLATLAFPTITRLTIVRRETATQANPTGADLASPSPLASTDTPTIDTPALSAAAPSRAK